MSISRFQVRKRAARIAVEEFLRAPAKVGSAFPATSRMVATVLAPLKWSEIDLLVEYGPGTGHFTSAALARMRPDARLIGIEPGTKFVDHLRTSISDRRLRVVQGSAENVAHILSDQGARAADCIVSGLPFSTLDAYLAEEIMNASASVLGTHGMFAAYQMRNRLKPLLKRYFSSLHSGYEWWNVPPCHLYWATNPRGVVSRGKS
ncbi:phospholipid N-methyltransferase [Novosphingobium sp. PhB165]|uniref:class I SAM-dependent methyltransferase n=1 Tax=Novosphingobium sp. PhB165 TaxID=2485105 RepID=UPI00104B0B77|nr:methyltransferase [Novosphingobium sp. PhB165]TCM13993.1 phospholipid N-methyltransferase [Novosphingobium sp. PhB165]